MLTTDLYYCTSNKSCPILCCDSLYKNGQGFFGIRGRRRFSRAEALFDFSTDLDPGFVCRKSGSGSKPLLKNEYWYIFPKKLNTGTKPTFNFHQLQLFSFSFTVFKSLCEQKNINYKVHWLSKRQTEWQTKWQSAKQSDWEPDKVTEWQTEWLSGGQSDWVADKVTEWQTKWLSGRQSDDWVADKVTDWVTGTVTDCPTKWLRD